MSLQALTEHIDEIKSEYNKLEAENRFLQDYIGNLTRTMSARASQPDTVAHCATKRAISA